MVGQEDPVLAGLPEPGEPAFYPKVGHCIYRGVTEDPAAPGTSLLELEDIEEGSRILIPLSRVPKLNLRPAGVAFDEIKEILSSEFEEPVEDEDERHALIEELVTEGSPSSLSRALKQLHLLRQTAGLTREEEQSRKKIRSWLAAEVSLSRESTRAEAQAFMTRVLHDTMEAHREKEKKEAQERRRAAKELKKSEESESSSEAPAADASSPPEGPKDTAEARSLLFGNEPQATPSEENKPTAPSDTEPVPGPEDENATP